MSDEEARLPRLDAQDAPEAMRPAFDRFLRERGRIPNLFRVAAHRPGIGATLAEHMREVMGAGTVDTTLKELLSIRVSHVNRCEY